MPTITYHPAATRTLRCLTGPRADRALHHQVCRALERLAVDPRHPGLRTHRHHALPGHLGDRVFGSRVGAGSGWRIHWTWTGRDNIEVVRIGPHP
ncbi:hypothetical protein [Kitasatospora sp. CB01950]|uniref:hypothetical protein n=1 Tax=Kitasatospora sp. CB01950 TaxID=1703930 RepID=UPI00093C1AF8|nr:hypothetical protein [Kitasatospora sp. CB01950]OKI95111.1 hypothetical protein AMK19_33140 [Kitasatospora sp. CB01950]